MKLRTAGDLALYFRNSLLDLPAEEAMAASAVEEKTHRAHFDIMLSQARYVVTVQAVSEARAETDELVLENDVDDGVLILCRGEYQLISWSMSHGSTLEETVAAFNTAGIQLKIKLIS